MSPPGTLVHDTEQLSQPSGSQRVSEACLLKVCSPEELAGGPRSCPDIFHIVSIAGDIVVQEDK